MQSQDFFLGEDEAAEGGDDYKIAPSDFTDIFVVPSDWTVSTLRQELVDIVDLDPHFQRRSVWTHKAKSKFIESLVLGIPIPQILLAERMGERNKFLVLDGKQRLSAIKEFFQSHDDPTQRFRIQGLDDLKELNNKDWTGIKHDYPEVARAIEAAAIRTVVIRGWRKDDVLYEIFHRLNSGSVKLSPMELRMSLIRGPYVKEVIRQTANCQNLQKMLGLTEPDKRMKDVEIAIRHFAMHDFSVEYKGNLKEFLDNFCRNMNTNFEVDQKIPGIDDLEELIFVGLRIFPKKTFSRKYIPESDKFQPLFNRALFDILGGSLMNAELRDEASKEPDKFLSMYKSMFSNTSFVRSIETTTKSISATKFRFRKWYGEIKKEYGIELREPIMSSND